MLRNHAGFYKRKLHPSLSQVIKELGNIFPYSAGIHLQNHTVSRTRTQQYEYITHLNVNTEAFMVAGK
jgi:hypothetical protein